VSSRAPSKSVPGHLSGRGVLEPDVLERAKVTTLSRAVLKRDRSLPVPAHFADALRGAGVSQGLVRGSVYAIGGTAPVGLAMLLLAEASKSGAWIAWCAPTPPNPRALLDAGWSLDRFVCIDPQRRWAACMDACVGEFEVVVTQVPAGVPAGEARRVSAAVARSNGIVVGLATRRDVSMPADVEFRVDASDWNIESGHLQSQAMRVVLAGRRIADTRRFDAVLAVS